MFQLQQGDNNFLAANPQVQNLRMRVRIWAYARLMTLVSRGSLVKTAIFEQNFRTSVVRLGMNDWFLRSLSRFIRARAIAHLRSLMRERLRLDFRLQAFLHVMTHWALIKPF